MAHRTFPDARGATWDVWDVIPRLIASEIRRDAGQASISGPLAQGWLAFQAGEIRRRLAPVPDGWEGASDEELRRWCDAAEAVVQRPPRQASPGFPLALQPSVAGSSGEQQQQAR